MVTLGIQVSKDSCLLCGEANPFGHVEREVRINMQKMDFSTDEHHHQNKMELNIFLESHSISPYFQVFPLYCFAI